MNDSDADFVGTENPVTPKVTVIVPAFNQEKYVLSCMGSILSQTHKNLEVMVVDDGCTDDTWNIIEKEFGNDERISIVHNGKNMGIGFSRKEGVKFSTGDFISFLSTDGLYDTHFVEHMLISYKLGGAGDRLLYSQYYMINENGAKVGLYTPPTFETQDDFLVALWSAAERNTMFTCMDTIFGPAKIFKQNPFDEGLRQSEDLEWVLRTALQYRVPYQYVPEPLMFYRLHSESGSSKTMKDIHKINFPILEKFRRNVIK